MTVTAEGITVRQLIDLPYLRTEVVAGHGGLDRRISWAQVSESKTPWDWHEPGDLVLTSGMIIPLAADEQVEFVRKLAATGLSGLLAGTREPTCPKLTQAMLDIADELDFPLLILDHPVPFAAHVRAVAAANDRGENASLRHIMRVHEEVRQNLIAQRSSAEFVDALNRVLGCECCVVDAEWWEPALPGCPAPGPEWRPPFERELAARGGLEPLALRIQVDDEPALAMPIPVERPTFLVISLKVEPAPRLAVLQHVAAACALEITRVNAMVERQRRSGASLLSEALAGRVDGSLFEIGLRERGLEPPHQCVAIEGKPHALDRLIYRWTLMEVPYLLAEVGSGHLAIVSPSEATHDRLTELVESEQCRVGVSDPFAGLGGLTDSARQARWALETIRPTAAGVAHYGDSGDTLLPRTVAEAKLVTNRILGPLLAYDREHETELIKTLSVYLDCDRSPKRAAELLFVHTQTVTYRINRVQQLTGRSMHSTGDISELWFALRALALSETAP
jgi:purine catabolism regulator